MKRTFEYTIIGLCLVLVVFSTVSVKAATGATVIGKVVNKDGKPIPGLGVYLVHPELGRSSKRSTNDVGRFTFSNVPKHDDPYYLEIYWGKELIYRKAEHVQKDKDLGTIVLR